MPLIVGILLVLVLVLVLEATVGLLESKHPWFLSRFALEFSRPLRASVRSFFSIHQVAPHDLDLDLDQNTPWVNMSPYAKFGLDRPSRSAGYRQHTDKQTNIQT